ncbi:MAG: phosphoribosylglycinamide formyltransferase [Eudoraea sp.]|nr:phosphoribosylglycinamide formyltransferase [Eudoraea sp.]
MSTEKKLNWAILVTGWGRNAADTIENYRQGLLKRSDIKFLIYQSLPCGAAEAAEKAGIETMRLLRKDFPTAEDYQHRIIDELRSRDIDYVLLLSYKYIIRQDMLKAFPNRIVNIHPSLFPSFLATTTAIQEALAYGVRISGITTHIIDDKIDEGTILCQEPIRFEENETFESVYPKFAATAPKLILDTISLIEKKHFNN